MAAASPARARARWPAQPAFASLAMSISVARVTTPADLAACHALRRAVFVDELRVPPTVEFDAHDAAPPAPRTGTVHYLATDRSSGAPLATCRVRAPHPATRKVERFCVGAAARGRGVGRALAAAAVADADAGSGALLYCHAKRDTAAFYERLGWARDGPPFDEAGVPHVAMVRRARPVASGGGLGHVCLRTHDIERARMFYSLLGYSDAERFVVEGCRVAWIQSAYLDLRIELIEVSPFPLSVLRRDTTADMWSRDAGAYHLSVDASRATLSLRALLTSWNGDSRRRFGRSINVVVPPTLVRIGGGNVETAMVSDADGNLVEVLRRAWEVPADESGGAPAGDTRFEWQDDGVARSDVVLDVP